MIKINSTLKSSADFFVKQSKIAKKRGDTIQSKRGQEIASMLFAISQKKSQ